MPRVFLPVPLRDLTGGLAELELPATTVRECVDELERRYPGIAGRLCAGGELAPSLQLSIDGQFSRRGLEARLTPGSEVHFLPVFGGG